MKNERQSGAVSVRNRRAKKTLLATSLQRNDRNSGQFPIFQRGLGGFSSTGRIYDPITAQFMQADNYIQTPEDYIGYNRYAYCRYNPFKFVDPSGEMLTSEIDNSSSYVSEGQAVLSGIQAYQNGMSDKYFDWLEHGGSKNAFASDYGSGGGGGNESATSGTNTGNASQENSAGRKGSDVVPIPLDPNKIKIGQIITGRDGKQYTKGENGLFYEVGAETGKVGGTNDQIVATTIAALTNSTSAMGGLLGMTTRSAIASGHLLLAVDCISIYGAAVNMTSTIIEGNQTGFKPHHYADIGVAAVFAIGGCTQYGLWFGVGGFVYYVSDLITISYTKKTIMHNAFENWGWEK